MEELSRQIQVLLPREKQFLHQIYIKTIEDYSFLWDEIEDLGKLRGILILIVRLFIEEHRNLNNLSKSDRERLKKTFKELISNRNSLLQMTRRSQIREIEGIHPEEWFKRFWADISTINQIIENYDVMPDYLKKVKYIKFRDLSWKIPRTTLDFLCAYIQFGYSHTASPPYTGLLNSEEKREFNRYRNSAESAWSKKPTPADRLRVLIQKYHLYSQASAAEVSGNVFLSKAFDDSVKKEAYKKDLRRARVSFSLNLKLIDHFFDWMIKILREGPFAEVPIKFKIASVFQNEQGNGENAHLYFTAANEGFIYNVLTEQIYPMMQRYGLNAPGGRFLMIPVEDKHGNPLRGVEFGQGMHPRVDIITPERNAIFKQNSELATSDVIAYVIDFFYSHTTFTSNFERFKKLYNERGRVALVSDGAFFQVHSHVRKKLIELGRDPSFPILDRDAKVIFPNFTRTILNYKPHGV